MSIEVANSLNVGKTNTVLDIRSRIEKEADIYNIKYPAIGGLVYCIENEKFYVIKTLVAAEINGYTIANYKVGTYEELNVGGAKYTAGEGITIAENVISVDWKKVAKKEDIKGISIYGDLENRPEIIGDDHITVTLKSAGAIRVAGAGNTESDGEYIMDKISATGASRVWRTDDRKLYYVDGQWRIVGATDATIYYYLIADETADPWSGSWKTDYNEFEPLPTVSKAENSDHDVWEITIDATALISVRDGKVFASDDIELLTKTEFDKIVGDINSILDAINGEVI